MFHVDISRKLLNRFGEIDPSSELISPSLYANHLKRFLEFFPRSQIHIVDGENLQRNNPSIELAKIEKFLGKSNYFTSTKFSNNTTKGYYCFVSDMGKHKCLGNAKGRRQELVDERVVSKLKQFFKCHNEDFFRIVNKNFSWFV